EADRAALSERRDPESAQLLPAVGEVGRAGGGEVLRRLLGEQGLGVRLGVLGLEVPEVVQTAQLTTGTDDRRRTDLEMDVGGVHRIWTAEQRVDVSVHERCSPDVIDSLRYRPFRRGS